ncbi:hypothetical protein DUNSADRAFT_12469 [Dunaliella salina]|uniref:Uncharacterized protein n=1 Tax=Dunaliella salina TaxID=3046 RepID=A0ABQ7H3V3_DUNSA|nr:hypothetical protein DUNSADRAFT_12469 [Dunaliella salina]|eukprot:KAF5841541.1 hypothetical protein DUNSADRAFT_12469 [Dunaliella salina]
MSSKRQRVEAGRVLIPEGLSLYDLKENMGIQSPGSPFGSRIVAVQASPDHAHVYIAAGQGVHAVRVELGKGDAGAGKEGVVLPRRSQLKDPLQHCAALHAQAEIQSLSIAQIDQGRRTALISMDAYGRGLMSVGSSDSKSSSTNSTALGSGVPTFVLTPPGQVEAG